MSAKTHQTHQLQQLYQAKDRKETQQLYQTYQAYHAYQTYQNLPILNSEDDQLLLQTNSISQLLFQSSLKKLREVDSGFHCPIVEISWDCDILSDG